MRKVIKFLSILGIVSLASLALTTDPAQALESCANQSIVPSEPHPLRPNPYHSCSNTVPQDDRISCGTDLVVVKSVEVGRGGPDCTPTDPALGPIIGGATCSTDVTVTDVPISIDLHNLELPIAGVASNTAVSDTISDGLKMRNYTSWYLQGATQQADEEVLNPADPSALQRQLNYAGPLKKLVPPNTLDQHRIDLINAAGAGTTYNQIIGYVDNATNAVIGRKAALAYFALHPTGTDIQKIRLTDMAGHEKPLWVDGDLDAMKWHTLWQQVPFTQTVDLAGEVFATISQADPGIFGFSDPNKTPKLVFDPGLTVQDLRVNFPHLVEDDQLAQLGQSLFLPSGIDATTGYRNPNSFDFTSVNRDAPYNTSYCPPTEHTPWNPGDNLGSTTTINGKFTFTKHVQYSYPKLTPKELLLYPGYVPPVQIDVSAPISIFTRTPYALDNIYDRLIHAPGGIYRALYPLGGEPKDYPAAAGMTFGNCGTDCVVNPANQAGQLSHLFFPHLGTILINFHQQIQCMLDPLHRCGGDNIGSSGPNGEGGKLSCSIDMKNNCSPVNLSSAYIQAYINAYNPTPDPHPESYTLVGEPWAQALVSGVGGVCPAFTTTIWLEESGGSAIGSYDLGCIYNLTTAAPSRANRHPRTDAEVFALPSSDRCFGGTCATTLRQYRESILKEQLACFKSYTDNISDFRTFMCQYSGETDTDPNTPYRQCDSFVNNPNFPQNVCSDVWPFVGTP